MNRRLPTWILAALLILSGGHAIPSSRVAMASAGVCVTFFTGGQCEVQVKKRQWTEHSPAAAREAVQIRPHVDLGIDRAPDHPGLRLLSQRPPPIAPSSFL